MSRFIHKLLYRLGIACGKCLSLLVAHPKIEGLSRSLETYWSLLLGKGAGTGWTINPEIQAAQRVINTPSPVIFDIGANTGYWAERMLAFLPQARIYMFEPQPVCRQKIAEKNLPNTTILPYAVSAKRGFAALYTPEGTAGIASLYPRRDTYFQQFDFSTYKVETITIDEVIEEQKITCVDFLKMDIEGHELDALRGAQESLKTRKIKALLFEFGSGNINSRTFFHDFWDLLHPMGFDMYRVLPSSRLLPIKTYHEDLEYFNRVTNYIAVQSV